MVAGQGGLEEREREGGSLAVRNKRGWDEREISSVSHTMLPCS